MHLIIAEKNIAAQRIASILAGKEKVKPGKENGVNTYRFDDAVALGLRGHVVEIDFEPGYTNWRSEVHTPRTLIDAGTVKKPTEKKIVTLIKKLARHADKVTIATDFDREGELIGKEAYELVYGANPKVPVQRARFSAITPQEINQAFESPAGIDFDLAAAGETRQLIDLIWGASLTRFISIAARRGGANILSVGRVQSPVLAMIVDREKEIEAFVPEPYWLVSLETEKATYAFEARHTHDKFWSSEEAEAAQKGTKEPLTVTSVKEGTRADRAPAPFDTTSFIVAASRMRISAANAMRIAEDLYMNGYISYPRTDNTVYPASLDLDGVLQELKKTAFSRDVEWTLAHRRPQPTRGKKSSTDHPPIHPTGAAKESALSADQWKVYELIVRRFLGTLSPDARWTTLKYLFDAGGEEYTATGSRLAEEGYRHVYHYSEAKETILPPLEEGERLPILGVINERKETTPPPRFSQAKLIQTMEELGLGTKSTRHEVIGKLIGRRYIEGAPLRPTLVGRGVTEALEHYASMITKPEMTSTLETHMEDIKGAKRASGDVIAESKEMLHTVFDRLEAHEEDIGGEIMERTDEEKIIGPCPVCGRGLMIRQTKGMSQFIGCTGYPDCTFNIGLPTANWGTAIRENDICPVHGLHHIRLIRKGARPWEIGCPLCNHIESNREGLDMMPSMDTAMIDKLHAAHIYSVYDVATTPAGDIANALGADAATTAQLQEEAKDVLEMMRRRTEMKKFVRRHVVPRRGRSPAKVSSALIKAGINDLGALAEMDTAALVRMHLSEAEAEGLLAEVRMEHNTKLLREYGVPAVSLKKYMAGGITSPADFCALHPAYLAAASGIKVETARKHATAVCSAMGVDEPEKVTQKMVDAGKKELLAIPGLGESALLHLYMAGIYDAAGLAAADPEKTEQMTGIPAEKIRAFQKAL